MKKILYLSLFPEGWGDAIANYTKLSRVKKFISEPTITHGLIHQYTIPQTGFWLYDYNLMDKVYPVSNYENFNYIVKTYLHQFKYDYIIVSEVCEFFENVCELVKPLMNGNCKIITEIQPTNKEKNIIKIDDWMTENCVYDNGYFSCNDFNSDIRKLLSLSENNKIACLFPSSTRKFAHMSPSTTICLIQKLIEKKYYVYLCGEIFNCYHVDNVNGNNWYDEYKSIELFFKNNNMFYNIGGILLKKQIEIMKRSNIIIMSPTGINLIPFLIKFDNPEIYILLAGNTTIMYDIYMNNYNRMHFKNNIHFLKTECSYFPCDVLHNKEEFENDTVSKPIFCNASKYIKCLDDELDIRNIINKLPK